MMVDALTPASPLREKDAAHHATIAPLYLTLNAGGVVPCRTRARFRDVSRPEEAFSSFLAGSINVCCPSCHDKSVEEPASVHALDDVARRSKPKEHRLRPRRLVHVR